MVGERRGQRVQHGSHPGFDRVQKKKRQVSVEACRFFVGKGGKIQLPKRGFGAAVEIDASFPNTHVLTYHWLKYAVTPLCLLLSNPFGALAAGTAR